MELTTSRLVLKTVEQADLEKLNIVYEKACEYFSFDEKHEITPPKTCCVIGDLPPNGTKENFEMLTVFCIDEIIGYLTFYKGYPDSATAYICFLFLTVRGNGYGKEIAEAMTTYLNENGFSKIKLAVSLKNWNGIKFWQKCGFDKLTLVDISEEYGCIELEKSL
jgi:RimJ/RimL family protein N-acetyltransferase